MSVKRYSVWQDEMFDEKHALNPKNSMVHLMVMHDDYAALEARCAALAAENAGLKAANAEGCKWDGEQWVGISIETPATEAVLAEVRAQGVEMAACALDDVNQFNYANMLDDLAQKLRQEAAQ